MSTITREPMPPQIRSEVECPAGTYVVGDPCYSVPDDAWMEWLEASDYTINDRRHVLAANVNGRLCVGVSTAFGDGTYPGSNGAEYGVDAGLLGVVPIDVAKDVARNREVGLVTVETFDRPFRCWFDDGTVHLGHITIRTNWDDLDDEDDPSW